MYSGTVTNQDLHKYPPFKFRDYEAKVRSIEVVSEVDDIILILNLGSTITFGIIVFPYEVFTWGEVEIPTAQITIHENNAVIRLSVDAYNTLAMEHDFLEQIG